MLNGPKTVSDGFRRNAIYSGDSVSALLTSTVSKNFMGPPLAGPPTRAIRVRQGVRS